MTTLDMEMRADGALEAREMRACPNCGVSFAAGGRGMGKTFCGKDCRVAFHARSKAEGAVMAALVKCWIGNRHAKPGTREADMCRKARAELTQIARLFLDEDKAAGRPDPTDYVEGLLADTLYVDRARRL